MFFMNLIIFLLLFITYTSINERECLLREVKIHYYLVTVIQKYFWGATACMHFLLLVKVYYLWGAQVWRNEKLCISLLCSIDLYKKGKLLFLNLFKRYRRLL